MRKEQEQILAEARSVLCEIPRTEARVHWRTAPGAVDRLRVLYEQYIAVGGTCTRWCRRLEIHDGTWCNLRRGVGSDGTALSASSSPRIQAVEVKPAIRAAQEIVAAARTKAKHKRVEWGKHPKIIADLHKLWLESGENLGVFGRSIGVDPTVFRLHFRAAARTEREAELSIELESKHFQCQSLAARVEAQAKKIEVLEANLAAATVRLRSMGAKRPRALAERDLRVAVWESGRWVSQAPDNILEHGLPPAVAVLAHRKGGKPEVFEVYRSRYRYNGPYYLVSEHHGNLACWPAELEGMFGAKVYRTPSDRASGRLTALADVLRDLGPLPDVDL